MSVEHSSDLDWEDDWDGNELSDEQIKALLQKAEQQLLKTSPNQHIAGLKPNYQLPKLNAGSIAQPYVSTVDGVARVDRRRLLNEEDRRASNQIRCIEDPLQVRERAKKEKHATAGFNFFDMPATQLSPELQADLRLLKVRSVLDPQRHYKKDSLKKIVPDFSEVGRIIEGPTERYSARLPNKDRKRTLVEEVLASESSTGRFKRKYSEIQIHKSSGKKAYYKDLKSKRSGGRKS